MCAVALAVVAHRSLSGSEDVIYITQCNNLHGRHVVATNTVCMYAPDVAT